MTDPNLTAALALAERGIAVFPCDANKRPRPGVRWKEEATTDAKRIESWWRRYPNSLPAFSPGQHGLVAIECDRNVKEDGFSGIISRASENDDDPRDWPTVETPSSGRHVFFRQDGSLTNARGSLPAGIDVRGSGGYVIAEGATLPDGRDYHPIGDGLVAAMSANALPELPAWLRATICDKPQPIPIAPLPAEPRTSPAPRPDNIGARERAAFEAALDAEVRKVATAGEGQRNHTLNTAAFCLAQMVASGWGSRQEVETALTEAAFAAGLRQPEISKTIRSGINSGMAKPRPPLGEREGYSDAGHDIEIKLTKVGGVTINAETGEIVAEDEPDDEADESEAPAIDEGLTHVDGVLGQITDWITACSPTGNRLLALSAALPLMGTLLGRRMATPTGGGGGLELYVISLLPSGGGKSVPMAAVARLLEVAGLDNQHIAPPEFRSGAAFGDFLCRSPLSLSIVDEVADYLAVMLADKQQSHQVELEKLMKEQWGKGFASLRTAHSKTSGSGKIFAPCYSIYGATTPDAFFRTIKSKHISGGFANRLTVIDATQGSKHDREPTASLRHPPDALVDAVRSMYAMGIKGRGNLASFVDKNAAVDPDPVIVPWGSQDAQDAFTAFEAECRGLIADLGEIGKIYGRTAFMAVKIATIRACGRMSPVTRDDMEWGIAIARQSADLFRHELASKMLDPLTAGELLQRIAQQFLKPTLKGEALMAKYGPMTLPKRFLWKNLRHHTNRHPGEFDSALKAMESGGEVRIGKMTVAGVKDTPVIQYLRRRRPAS
ncbi:MAG: bifunctional DNA primase/polymerase [Beijerinckiaceae bacterium]|nr:bifunctional DNA primase/polymerase [Beijerinckiaceae bacterium]